MAEKFTKADWHRLIVDTKLVIGTMFGGVFIEAEYLASPVAGRIASTSSPVKIKKSEVQALVNQMNIGPYQIDSPISSKWSQSNIGELRVAINNFQWVGGGGVTISGFPTIAPQSANVASELQNLMDEIFNHISATGVLEEPVDEPPFVYETPIERFPVQLRTWFYQSSYWSGGSLVSSVFHKGPISGTTIMDAPAVVTFPPSPVAGGAGNFVYQTYGFTREANPDNVTEGALDHLPRWDVNP